MPTFKNKRAANCKVCGNPVPIGTGWTEGPPWVTTCGPCSGRREDTPPKVAVTYEARRGIVLKLTDFLGGELFTKFRTATEGAKYDPADRANYMTVDKAVKILPALVAAGFLLDLAPGVTEAVQAKTDQLKNEVSNAHVRAAKVDEELKARGLALFPFQKHGVAWLASRDFAFLADDMGLGKTIQMLIALPEGAPVIVLGPAVAKSVWERETARWRPDLRVTVLNGRGSFRYPARGEMVVLTYDTFSLPEDQAPEQGTVLIADEAHLVKNANSKRGATFRTACEKLRTSGGKVWLASATPLMNRPPELWSLFNAVGLAQEAFGSWGTFVRLFDGVQDEYGGWSWGTPDPEVPERLRRVMLRRMKVDVLDQLPPKTYREIKVDLEAKWKKAFAKAEEAMASYDRYSRIFDDPKPSDILATEFAAEQAVLREILGEDFDTVNVATDMVRSLGRAGFEMLSSARKTLATAKIPAMIEVVEDFEAQEEPLVVFSDHRAPIDFLANRPGWAVITGDTSAEDRGRIQDEFQAGKLRGVAATIKAGGVAITLTRASNALFVDLNWTPALNAQAEDRVFRIGQSRGVVITTLVANNGLDKRLFELLASKRHIVEHSVDASRVQADAPAVEVQSVDLSEAARRAEEERRKDAEAKKAAEDRRKEFEAKQGEIQKQNEEAEEKRRNQERRERRHARWLREAEMKGGVRRMASSPREAWAVEQLCTLADLDPDRAREKNDVGFSASDGVGHRLAFLATRIGLTDDEWRTAHALCHKYRRQVGEFKEEVA